MKNQITAMTMVAGIVGILAAPVSGARAGPQADWAALPGSAFVDAYVFACQPVEYDFAGVQAPLQGAALDVYEQLFVRTYGNSCRAFYFGEVVPRLDPDRRPFFID